MTIVAFALSDTRWRVRERGDSGSLISDGAVGARPTSCRKGCEGRKWGRGGGGVGEATRESTMTRAAEQRPRERRHKPSKTRAVPRDALPSSGTLEEAPAFI